MSQPSGDFCSPPKNKLLQLIHTRKLLSDALSASNISKYWIADAYNVNVCQFQWWMAQHPADFIVFDNVYLMLGWDNSPHWESPTCLISLITTLMHSISCHQTEEASCVNENQCFSGSPAETFKRYMSVTHTEGIQNSDAPERYKCEDLHRMRALLYFLLWWGGMLMWHQRRKELGLCTQLGVRKGRVLTDEIPWHAHRHATQ